RKMISYAQVGLGDDLDIKCTAASSRGESPLASRNSALMLTYGREGNTEIGSNLSDPLEIAQPLGEGLGGAQVVRHPLVFTKRQQGITQVKPQIDSLLQRVAALREMGQRRQRLVKIRHGFAIRRARDRPTPGLRAIDQGFVPQLAPHDVMR